MKVIVFYEPFCFRPHLGNRTSSDGNHTFTITHSITAAKPQVRPPFPEP